MRSRGLDRSLVGLGYGHDAWFDSEEPTAPGPGSGAPGGPVRGAYVVALSLAGLANVAVFYAVTAGVAQLGTIARGAAAMVRPPAATGAPDAPWTEAAA